MINKIALLLAVLSAFVSITNCSSNDPHSGKNRDHELSMVGGTNIIPADHPGVTSTAALINMDTGELLCTAVIVANNLALSAKHCLYEVPVVFGPVAAPGSLGLFFGSRYEDFGSSVSEDGIIVPVSQQEIMHAELSRAYFPRFDIGYLKLDQPLPDFVKPVTILRDIDLLQSANDGGVLNIDLVGYGIRQNPGPQARKGIKKKLDASIGKVISGDWLGNLLEIETTAGTGPCHGDSGGPAFAKIDENEWILVGLTQGITSALNPEAFYGIDFEPSCDGGSSLYTFPGGYGDFILAGSEQVAFMGESTSESSESNNEPLSESGDRIARIAAYCRQADMYSMQWATFDYVLSLAMPLSDSALQSFDASVHCGAAAELVSKLEDVKITSGFNDAQYIDGRIDLSFLALLPRLKKLKIVEVSIANISSLKDSEYLEELWFDEIPENESKIFIPALPNLKKLFLTDVGIVSIDQIGLQDSLEHLMVDGSGSLDLMGLERFTDLNVLSINNHSYIANLEKISTLRHLEKLFLNNNALRHIDFLSGLQNLETLFANNNQIEDVSVLLSLENLQSVTMRGNPDLVIPDGLLSFSLQY